MEDNILKLWLYALPISFIIVALIMRLNRWTNVVPKTSGKPVTGKKDNAKERDKAVEAAAKARVAAVKKDKEDFKKAQKKALDAHYKKRVKDNSKAGIFYEKDIPIEYQAQNTRADGVFPLNRGDFSPRRKSYLRTRLTRVYKDGNKS